MNKRKSLVILGFSLVLALLAGLVAGAIPFAEGFDTAVVGAAPAGWIDGGDVKAASIVVDNTVFAAHTPPNCLKMNDDSPGGSAQITRWFGDQAKGTIRFALYNTADHPGDLYCTLTKGNEKTLDVDMSGGKSAKYRDQAGVLADPGFKYTLDAWHIVEIKWDVATGKFNYSVDGVKVGDFPLIKNIVPDTVIFKYGSSNKVDMLCYLDSIELKAE